MRFFRSPPAIVVAIWIGVAVFSYGQDYVNAIAQNEMETFRAGEVVLYEILRWAFWIPITLVILRLQRVNEPSPAHTGRFVAAHVAIALLTMVASSFYQAAIVKLVYGETQSFLFFVQMFATRALQTQVFIYAAVLAGVYALSSARRLRERERATAELETRLARAQLEALEMQLHPHFLFNTLQTIVLLVRRDPDLAEVTVRRLGELLRVTLDQRGAQEVPLREEMEMLQLYLEIERTRFPDRLRVDIDVPADIQSAAVPSLILQPLVENALRHAVEPRSEGGTVRISGWRRDDLVHLSVSDDGPGMPPHAGGEGIGLTNTRERLTTMYGKKAFAIGKADLGGVEAHITIPFRRVADVVQSGIPPNLVET